MTTCQGSNTIATPYWTKFSYTAYATGFGFLETCSSSARPSTEFVCYNGTWISSTGVTTTTLVIPAGATTTIVNGNISSTTLVFQSLGSTLTIYGCANNLTSITIELSPEELKLIQTQGLQQTLLNYSSLDASCADLSTVTIIRKLHDSSCKDVTAKKAVSNGHFLPCSQ